MPRYFFHVYDHALARDDDGIELADREAAKREAIRGARALACEQAEKGVLHLEHRVEVEDEEGRRVFSVRYGDAVQVMP